MPIVRLRNLGTQGILTDPDPYALPLGAFSGGVNVRFRNNHVSSAPAFRAAIQPLSKSNPRFTCAATLVAGNPQLFLGYQNGTISSVTNASETDVTVSGYTPSAVEAFWTSTTIGNIVFINRSDRAPWFLGATGTRFTSIAPGSPGAGDWNATWSCRVLRQCAGALVALNVTKGATNSPTLVKTSAPVALNTLPSWDQTNPATLATENTLSALDGPIQDACGLGQDLIIYGARECWRMHADGSTFVYNYTKLPFKKGSLNTNCSVEIDGKNYVFGIDDLWVHDGISEKSLCDQKVRDFIFSSANVARADAFFVSHNPRLNEIYFCYVSGDQFVNYLNGVSGCNRQAVYNITNDTWTFDDLPSVFFGTNGPLSHFLTYASVSSSYSAMGGSYQDQEDGDKRVNVYVGDNSGSYSLQNSLYAFDLTGPGSVAPFPVDTNATAPVYLERIGIDLDDLEANLRDYKQINTIYPQARIDTSAGSALMVDIGASDFVNSAAPVYAGYQAYDGVDNYKLDYNIGGRWLAIRMKWADFRPFILTGFDLHIQTTGRR